MMKMQASWWIIGSNNTKQPRAIAVDIHDGNGDLCGEAWTCVLKRKQSAEAVAMIYAGSRGVHPNDVHHDADSTEAFADC